MKIDFTGKTILITGATRGIGAKIADDLKKLGAILLLTGTQKSQIEQLNSQQGATSNITYLHLDFNDKQSINLLGAELEKVDRVDGLVNNAGINKLNSVENILENDWEEMLFTNLTGPFQLIKLVSSKMIRQNYGRIINIGSIFSKISKERRTAYSATKFGLHGLTVGSSIDLARYNVLVNTLSPGFVMTDLTRKNLSEQEIKSLSEQIPANRMADVSDISNVAVFLLSEHNTYLTGQNIIVDGGFTNV